MRRESIVLRNWRVALLFLCGSCSHPPHSPIPLGAHSLRPSCQLNRVSCVLIETSRQTLTVLKDGKPVFTIPRVALSPEGAGRKEKSGDGIVPLGSFRIARILRDSPYGDFAQLNYPRVEDADEAFSRGQIDTRTRNQVRDAHEQGRLPPQTTPLGGSLGIHGLGTRNPEIHELANWTRGCIAATNEEMAALLPYLTLGMEVTLYDARESRLSPPDPLPSVSKRTNRPIDRTATGR